MLGLGKIIAEAVVRRVCNALAIARYDVERMVARTDAGVYVADEFLELGVSALLTDEVQLDLHTFLKHFVAPVYGVLSFIHYIVGIFNEEFGVFNIRPVKHSHRLATEIDVVGDRKTLGSILGSIDRGRGSHRRRDRRIRPVFGTGGEAKQHRKHGKDKGCIAHCSFHNVVPSFKTIFRRRVTFLFIIISSAKRVVKCFLSPRRNYFFAR